MCETVILKNTKNYEIKRDEVLPRDEVLRVTGIDISVLWLGKNYFFEECSL
jgi:hypothetical protein